MLRVVLVVDVINPVIQRETESKRLNTFFQGHIYANDIEWHYFLDQKADWILEISLLFRIHFYCRSNS